VKAIGQVLVALLLRPLWIAALILAFYVLAVLLVWMNPNAPVRGLAFLLAIPTCAFFALATSRLHRYGTDAYQLGVPDHRRRLFQAQLVMLVLMFGMSLAPMLVVRGQWNDWVPIMAAAAFGVLLVRVGGWLLYVPFFLVSFDSHDFRLKVLLDQPLVVGVMAVGSCWVLLDWLRLGEIIERRAAVLRAPFADRRQERRGAKPVKESQVADEPRNPLARMPVDELDAVLHEIDPRRVSVRAFWFGIGFDAVFRWRKIAIGCGIAAVLILAWQFWYRRRAEMAPLYFLLFTSVQMALQGEDLARTFRYRGNEQSILALTPFFPERRSLKRYFLIAVAQRCMGLWCAALVGGVLLWALGWLRPAYLAAGTMLLLVMNGLALCGILLEAVRRSQPMIRFGSIAALFGATGGAALLAISMIHAVPAWVWRLGVVLAFGPSTLYALIGWKRPVQWPTLNVRPSGPQLRLDG